MTDFAQDGILIQVGMGGCIGLFGAYSFIPPTTCPCGKFTWWHWRLLRTPGSLTLVSETTKHILLQWACNRHLSMVENYLMLQDRLGKQNLVISFTIVRVYYLTTVERKEFLPGSPLSHLDYGSTLLPCAVSSTWTWVNQLLTLVQWLGWYRTTTYLHFKTLSHLGHLYVGFAMTSRSSTEGLGDFSESVVFHVVFLGVFLGCVGLVLVGLFCCFCVCVVLKTPSFLLSPILQHVGIANLRQNVLMTVWASSAHGMSSKKNLLFCLCGVVWSQLFKLFLWHAQPGLLKW